MMGTMRRDAIRRTPTLPRWFALLAVASMASIVSRASAQSGDGVYGRFDSSTTVVLGAGVSTTTRDPEPRLLLDARLRVIDCVGIATTASIAPGSRTRLFAGVELRPFFPGLFLQSMSTGRRFVDLFVQSFGVELGADVALASRASPGFVWGLSIELPILAPDVFAHGLGLRLGMRHTAYFGDARPNPTADASVYEVYALLALGLDAGRSIANWEPVRHRHR